MSMDQLNVIRFVFFWSCAMNVSSLSAVASTSRRVPRASQTPVEQAPHANHEDVFTGRPNRPQSRDELRTFDDALALVTNLRSGILANGSDAMSAQANQSASGLAELLS